MKNLSVSVKISNGEAEFIWDDSLADLMEEGPSSVTRASYVEYKDKQSGPQGSGWYAFMKDGTIFGPFKKREDALEEERAYLEEKMFK